MKYISAEQFSKQSKEVQKVFKDYFNLKPCLYEDIYSRVHYTDSITTKYFIPLLTEGELREFIEDKMNCIMDIDANIDSGYSLYLYFLEFGEFSEESRFASKIKIYEDLGKDLLQAYWQVACEVAKDSLKIN